MHRAPAQPRWWAPRAWPGHWLAGCGWPLASLDGSTVDPAGGSSQQASSVWGRGVGRSALWRRRLAERGGPEGASVAASGPAVAAAAERASVACGRVASVASVRVSVGRPCVWCGGVEFFF